MKNLSITLFLIIIVLSIGLQAQNGRRNYSNRNNVNSVEITGKVVKVNHPIAEVKGDDGKSYEVRLGPIWFWNDNNYKLNEGESVVIKGEIENSSLKNYIYPFTMKQGNSEIKFSDSDGFPLWSRGGKGYNGNGRGWCGRGNGRGNNRGYRR